MEVDAVELILPTALLPFVETARRIIQIRGWNRRFRWDHLLLWSGIIVLATVLSLLPYWQSGR